MHAIASRLGRAETGGTTVTTGDSADVRGSPRKRRTPPSSTQQDRGLGGRRIDRL